MTEAIAVEKIAYPRKAEEWSDAHGQSV